MRCTAHIILFLHLSGATLLGTGSERSDFQALADVTGDFLPNVPVRVPLTRAILSKAAPSFADIRLFDGQGRETPYVIYNRTTSSVAPSSFTFEVASFSQSDGADVLTLTRPANEGAYGELEFRISGIDFNKHVEVWAGADLDSLEPLASDAIFDFSSHVDLRKTRLRLPETDAHMLRIKMTNVDGAEQRHPEIRLQYEGLEFWTTGKPPSSFRVGQILGWRGGRESAAQYCDHFEVKSPKTLLDDDGNTVVFLDARLPLAKLTLSIANGYYYRRVQILASPDGVAPFTVAGAGVVFQMPGMSESSNTIRLHRGTHHWRLKVLNQDNPPLEINAVKISWVVRDLYFIPEANRSYELFVGSDVAVQPDYELNQLIPSDHRKLAAYAELTLSTLRENSSFIATPPQRTGESMERVLLTILLLVVVSVLTVWAYGLLRRLPANNMN